MASNKLRAIFRSAMLACLLFTIRENSTLQHWSNSPDSLQATSWNQKIVNIIHSYQEDNSIPNNPAAKVFLSFCGPVGAESIRWIGIKQGYQIDAFDRHRSDDLELAKTSAESADYIVLPNLETANIYTWLPSANIQAPLLEWALNHPQFKPIIQAEPQNRYFVFANQPRIETKLNVVQIDSIATIEGFLNEEGPYPHWSLPRVRWMQSKHSKICMLKKFSGPQYVELEFRPDSNGILQISDGNNSTLKAIELTPGKFQNLTFTLPASQNGICMNLLTEMPSKPDHDRLLLFSKIKIQGHD